MFFLLPGFDTEMSQNEDQQQKQQESSHAQCSNPGNPVFSCMKRVEPTSISPWVKPQSLLYRTTASEYGLHPPSFESSPCSYIPMSQAFSQHLGMCGMYRNHSLNTSVDRSRVYDCPNLQNTI
ncbi:piercer of microtubule wall 2 protein isoform X2 [Hoplias malabaricus]|uniref:piercer of microtubule wall 2 protein isoform X2 n=1 Tax=Hoplias malabaricus TaxID=27720 RepID=UPI003462B553